MNIGGIPPCVHTLATHRGLSLAWGVYPLLCRDTEDYRIPPAVSRHTGGIPLMRGVYPLVCRDTEDYRIPPAVSRHTWGIPPIRGVYPLLCRDTEDYRIPAEDYRIPPAVSRHTGGYTPHARGIPPRVSRHRGLYPLCCMPPLCRDTWGVYPPHDTGLITRLCQADISTTRHTTPAQE